jgi:hypothetical protein
MGFWWGFAIGLFVGANCGLVILALIHKEDTIEEQIPYGIKKP